MGIIKVFDQLPYKEERRLYQELQDSLLNVFGYDNYSSLETLRTDFQALMLDPYYSYLLDEFVLANEQYHIDVNELFKAITPNRWKLCKVCGKPFLDYTTFNKSKICYNSIYKRYSLHKGEFFTSAGEKSECYMRYKSKGWHKYKSEKQVKRLTIEG